MFRDIPTVLTSEELIDKMFRRAKKVEVAYSKNRLLMERNLSIAKIYTARDVAVSTLQKYIDSFPYVYKLHPFYRTLIDLLVDINSYKKSLSSLKWASGRIDLFASKYASKIKGAGKVEEILKFRKEFYGRAASIIKDIGPQLKYLNEARNIMRKIPDVDVSEPTVVIAGYPNVGKSALVERLSSAKPEIAPYPFTTKGIVVGHLDVKGRRIQIIDTPGLLDRPLKKRNSIEKQGILALKYLAGLIIFVLDPSETCGYSLQEQKHLLSEIKRDFKTTILVVENKSDMVKTNSENIKVSAISGEGIRELVHAILEHF